MERRHVRIIILFLLFLMIDCGLTSPIEVNTPQVPRDDYPVIIEGSSVRQQRAEAAWRLFLTRRRIQRIEPDLDPILKTPRSLPPSLAQKIRLSPDSGMLSAIAVKELLRQFVDREMLMLSGGRQTRELSLKDLSLARFSDESSFYRAVYHQTNFAFPVANGYGVLQITIDKNGTLLQLDSRLVPIFDFPSRARIDIAKVSEKLIGREFSYSGIAGRQLSYKVGGKNEIVIKDIVIYPKEDGNILKFYLAYPVEVGRGISWTVYFDAITGEEIESQQNFNT